MAAVQRAWGASSARIWRSPGVCGASGSLYSLSVRASVMRGWSRLKFTAISCAQQRPDHREAATALYHRGCMGSSAQLACHSRKQVRHRAARQVEGLLQMQ